MQSGCIVELTARTDDLLIPWMKLYEAAFPPPERVMFAAFLSILRDKEMGKIDTHRILALTGVDGELMGIGCDEYLPAWQAGYLWYIAIQPGLRGQGVGAQFYRYMVNTMLEKARLVIFEVEKPELGDTLRNASSLNGESSFTDATAQGS